MDSSSFEGLVLDPSKCSKLSVEEKREIVYALTKWSHGAPEMLQTWTRQDILQVLCAEIGKERKYTGLTKLKIIENLLKIVSDKSSQVQENKNESNPNADSSHSGQRATKRLRKNEHPTRITIETNDVSPEKGGNKVPNIICKNLACKANLSLKDRFCKRCSCCICHKYDDNKDPSLWLTCCSDPPYFGDSCGRSCHLECALRNGKSGIARDGMDGNFFCVSCGKLNDLLGCWRKQLIIAKETRRVDILCYRISTSQKLLSGTRRYQKPYEIVDEAKNKLEDDVGPLTGLQVNMSRGIVNRLSSGPEVQRLLGFALEELDLLLSRDGPCSLDSFVQEPYLLPSNIIYLEDGKDNLNNMIVVSSQSPVTFSSSLSNPSSVEDETNNIAPDNKNEKINNGICRVENLGDSSNLSGREGIGGELICYDASIVKNKELLLGGTVGEGSNDYGSNKCEVDLPITPCKLENMKPNKKVLDNSKEPQDGSSSKKRERRDEENMGNANSDFEYYVKVIRQLECEGYIEMNFRQKFLTWYSLRATPQEVRVVKVFVDTLIDDPSSLAGQLVDAFSDVVSSKRSSTVPPGFCMKLWH